ncbi:hypothetical protein BH18ACT13_BH18ACT13_10050 [soil metagenome]
MAADPLVTVVVAVYNGETYLGEALESAYAQDLDSYEVVFVDDGSTDRTAEIARSFPVCYLYQENQGPAAARNTAVEVACGDLIAFHDGDDVMPSTKLGVQVEYLSEHPETGCVLGRSEWIFENGAAPPWLTRDPIYGELGGIQPGTAMIRKQMLREAGGFDATYRYWEYQNLFVRLRQQGVRIDVSPDVVLRKRLHGANATLFPPSEHPLLRTMREKLERDRR